MAQTKVLFFGQKACGYSQKAYEFLQHLGWDVQPVWSINRTEKLPAEVNEWSGDYIFCFRSYFILRKPLLDRARVAAINFHPAPVEYPGSGCLNWALYDNSPIYGGTAHIMTAEIDQGAVVECRRFPVLPQDTVDTLLARAHLKTYDMIIDTATGLAVEGPAYLTRKLNESSHEKWRGKARKMHEIDALQNIPLSATAEETARIIRATHTAKFPPYVVFHGHKFAYTGEKES